MQKDDMSLARLGDILTAIALLTRIPVKAEFTRAGRASWAYPLAGLAIGLPAAALVGLALWMGVSAPLAAGLWIAATVVLSGAMHEDGLADCADGFWGGFEKPRRLEIMKDSQIGSYGVLALVLTLGLRWLAVDTLLASGQWLWPLLALEVLSRSVMPPIMHSLPHARKSGLSHAQGRPPLTSAGLAVAMGVLMAWLCLGWVALKLTLLLTLASFAIGALAQRKIGGQTGDVLGASQQLALVLCYLALI